MKAHALPVEAGIPRLLAALREQRPVVLVAPPGAGKSTMVPSAILDGLGMSVQVAQPRRMACRLLARRVAAMRNAVLGEEVGFATRHERRAGESTRLLFLTEGLLLRRMVAGDSCSQDIVVLDEFHERSIEADLLFGLLRRRGGPFVLMSATIDAQRIAEAIGGEVIEVEGRLHPIDVEHLRAPPGDPPWVLARRALEDILAQDDDGDILIFMPGRREIERTIEACRGVAVGLDLLPLHGDLPARDQDHAVEPGSRRKVIVSTNIAETSITIEGVTSVIDSGLARVTRHDSTRELDRLETTAIDQASAVQRSGRAGRVRPGRSLRLFTETDFSGRPSHRTPAVMREDLAGPFLLLRGVDCDPAVFPWLDSPPADAAGHATTTLQTIGAVRDGVITQEGRALAAMPVEPRIGRFLQQAAGLVGGRLAAACAAVLCERDCAARVSSEDLAEWLEAGDPVSDVVARARLVLDSRRASTLAGVDRGALTELTRAAKQLQRHVRPGDGEGDAGGVVEALLTAFPDRVAYRRDRNRDACVLPGRRNAVLDNRSIVTAEGFVVAASLRGMDTRGQGMTVLGLATAVPGELAERMLSSRITRSSELVFNADRGRVERLEQTGFEGHEIASVRGKPLGEDVADAAEILRSAVETGGLGIPGWDDGIERWIARVRCVAEWCPERNLPVYDEEDLAVVRAEVLGGATRLSEVRREAVGEIVRNALEWDDRQFVERMAPERIDLPGGGSLRLDYQVGESPRGRARIQQLFGLERTPTIAGGRIAVLLEILAPNQRPVQVTDDLESFWARTYPELKKELRRRYPKHKWP
ncbi:MAG: ATP-dependent helicase HrpB [Phycisphaerales bacterium]|nr:ATP-dependent helicase HrpB [Phycisphaerales bacterium]